MFRWDFSLGLVCLGGRGRLVVFALGLLRVGLERVYLDLLLVPGGFGIGFGVAFGGCRVCLVGVVWGVVLGLSAMALCWFSADRIIQTHSKPASIQNNTN